MPSPSEHRATPPALPDIAGVASVLLAAFALVLACAFGPVSLLLCLLGLLSGVLGAAGSRGGARRLARAGVVVNLLALVLFGVIAAYGVALHSLFADWRP